MKGFCLVLLGLFTQCLSAQILTGSKWVLISIDDLETGVSKEIGATLKATLQFDSDTSYSGLFCNHYQGHFKYNKERIIRIGLPSRAKKMCMGVDKYETEVMELLPLTNKYRIEDDILYLFTSSHMRLRYKREAK